MNCVSARRRPASPISCGNTASASGTFNVDTVTSVTFDAVATGGDGWVSGAENAGTVILRGTNESGATVSVTLNGTSYTAVVSGGTHNHLALVDLRWRQGETSDDYLTRTVTPYLDFEERIDGIKLIVETVRAHVKPLPAAPKAKAAAGSAAKK